MSVTHENQHKALNQLFIHQKTTHLLIVKPFFDRSLREAGPTVWGLRCALPPETALKLRSDPHDGD
jgi:hypothetical protein